MPTTPNQGWVLPTVDGSEDTWGDQLIAAWNELDTLMGTVSAEQIAILNGATVSTAELNKLSGLLSSTAELNVLSGILATTEEINTLNGFTGATADLNKLVGQTFGDLADKDILDEDDFATDSATQPPSQQSAKSYVDSKVASEIATMGGNQTGAAPVYGVRAWCNFKTNASNEVVIGGSGNIASITRQGAGQFSVTFSEDMPTDSYAAHGGYSTTASPVGDKNDGQVIVGNQTASGFSIRTVSGAANDYDPDGHCSFSVVC